jgi:hypothetical protein
MCTQVVVCASGTPTFDRLASCSVPSVCATERSGYNASDSRADVDRTALRAFSKGTMPATKESIRAVTQRVWREGYGWGLGWREPTAGQVAPLTISPRHN